ncbi:MAG: M56 family metallopeptidase [Ruminococcaceae bacterium]|nr:M56 family metallopeptidase [Oscillospiraceae bacterium]
MIGGICYWVINMSIVASFMGLIVMLIRKIKIIPHRVSVFLWIIPFLRMTVPVGINSPYSLMTLISRLTTKTVTVYQPTEDIALSYTNTIGAAESYSPITYKADFLKTVFSVTGFVWIIGSLALLIALTIIYVSTKRAVADSRFLKKIVYLSDKVDSPAVYGIFRPKIVIPESYKDKDLEYIVRHEKTHIKRLDNLWRILGFITAAVHWFNPLSWVFLKAFLTDLELACDEMAVAGFEKEKRKEYARTLLECSQSKSMLVSAFGGAKVRTRIENVLSYKKMTAFSAIGFTVLVLVIIITLITNAG